MIILIIIFILISFQISVIGSIYILINWGKFVSPIINYLTILTYILLGILFFTSYLLSTSSFIPEDISILLWEISIIFWAFSISILSFIHRLMVFYNNPSILSILFFSLIIGLIFGVMFIPDSFEFRLEGSIYRIIFKNLLLLIFLSLFNISVIFLMIYNSLQYLHKIHEKEYRRLIITITSLFSFLTILYFVYIITQNVIFRDFLIIFYLIGVTLITYIIITKNSLFNKLSNRIYDFIIFHKSGILLYSYNFETGEETDESLLKGSILIGINHILANFVHKKDQLRLIKIKNRDIVLEYDNLHGYALLLTTNQKNSFIDKAVKNFMTRFTLLNKDKLEKLMGIIDISEFRNAKILLTDFFKPYLKKEY